MIEVTGYGCGKLANFAREGEHQVPQGVKLIPVSLFCELTKGVSYFVSSRCV